MNRVGSEVRTVLDCFYSICPLVDKLRVLKYR